MIRHSVSAFVLALFTSTTSICLAQDDVTKENSDSGTGCIRTTGSRSEAPSNEPSGESNVADEVVRPEATSKQVVESLTVLYPAFALTPFNQPMQAELNTFAQPGLVIQSADPQPPGFNWAAASKESVLFLAFLHGLRFNQAKTRRELNGPFFADYLRSVKGLKGWGDGDNFATNYLGHPAMGSVSGYIQIHNDPSGVRVQFSHSKAYWKSRLKALGWSAAYSTQFELGLFSEATIGNVGKKPGTAGYVDLIVTPTLGTATILLEDAADFYMVRRIERRTRNAYLIVLARLLLNPTRSFANLLRLTRPWHRDRPHELAPSRQGK